MQFKKYVKRFFIIYILIVGSIGAFNYFIDSFWTFSHSNKFNNMQTSANERQQKTNKIYFQPFDYDTLVLGSSRTTFMDQNDLKDMNAFNYAISLVLPDEYDPYIEFAKEQNGRDFKKIVIGMDFFGTNKNVIKQEQFLPQSIIGNTTSFCYKYKLLFSIDTLKNSVVNVMRTVLNKPFVRSYTRENVAMTDKIDEKVVEQKVKNTTTKQAAGMENYAYNENLIYTLSTLKKNNPNTEFIIYTTPVASEYFYLLMKEGRFKDYEKWLKDLVKVFGQIYHFMTINDITKNYAKNFFDYHHAYPDVCKLIGHKISGVEDKNIPGNFGIVISDTNVDDYIVNFKKDLCEESFFSKNIEYLCQKEND